MKIEIIIFIEYVKYILKHKFYVLKECFKFGLYWQGIIHDSSKFSRAEFSAYKNMYTRTRITGKKPSAFIVKKFKRARLHHIHNNPHHWGYWLLNGVPLDMPIKYIKEMVADWAGVGIAITGKNKVCKWYTENSKKIIVSELTREKIEQILRIYEKEI